ncbi:MAG: hypothetical protein K2X82_32820 [Gemmataceae bacterium]|nr:hypothetical protein [Gemmataceae bacterium]
MTPTATPTPPAVDPTVTPAPPDLLAEPTWEELIEEGNRFYADHRAGRLDFSGIPEGHHFAYYGGKIHGHDADPNALEKRVGAALGVHWARVRVFYYGEW